MSQSIKFLTEAQIEEKRAQRQEEWDRTRKESDPIGIILIDQNLRL